MASGAPTCSATRAHSRRAARNVAMVANWSAVAARRSSMRAMPSAGAMPPAPSAEQSFRANLSQFRWARGNTDDSQPQQAQDAPANPFARFYHAVGGGYIPLRSSERSNEEEAYFALSRWDRCVAAVLQKG